MSIGDRCGADLEIALGLGELLGDRHLLPLDERKTVLRGENVEIGLRDPHYQVLRRLAESSFGLRCFESGFLVHLDILPIEDGLCQRDGVAVGVALPYGGLRGTAKGKVDVVPLRERGRVHRRQNLRQTLWEVFQAGVARRARRSVGGIVRERVAVDLQEIRCAGGRHRQGNDQ